MRFEDLKPVGILKINMTLTCQSREDAEPQSASFSLNVLLSFWKECLVAHCLEHSIDEHVNLIHLTDEYRDLVSDDRISCIMYDMISKLMARIISVIEAMMRDGTPEIALYADERYWQTYQQIERIATTESFQSLFDKPVNDAKYRNLGLSQILPAAYHSGRLSMSIDQVWASVEHGFMEEILG